MRRIPAPGSSDRNGAFLAWAAYSPSSRIRARAWSFDAAQRIDAGFLAATCAAAIAARARLDR